MKRLAAALVVLVMLGAGTAAYALTRRPEPGPPTEIVVEQGSSTAQIASALRDAGVISSTLGFRLLARVRGVDGRIQAGRYTLPTGLGVQAALDALARGPTQEFVTVTIPEGYTVRQVAARVARDTHIAEADMKRALASPPVQPAIRPAGVTSMEGFLFPETYRVNPRDTAETVAARMIELFNQTAAGLDFAPATERGLSPYEALIVASLIEREAKVDEDRTKVAAVIYNRLAKGMRLQIDATVLYDLPQHKVPNRKDLERESPYNTYLRDGLPPTPIANPGRAALEAALNPAPIDALYYVVIDPSGRHGFTADYGEFQRMLRLRPPETRG